MSATAANRDVGAGAYDAFICYNGEDQEEARRIKSDLETGHLRVFEASSDLHPGDLWMKEVSAAIASAKAALVLLGKSGGQRWAGLEWGELLREHQRRQMRIIPVLLPGAAGDPDIPFLGEFTRIDLRRDYHARLRELLDTIGGATAAAIVPKLPPSWWQRHRAKIVLALAAAILATAVAAAARRAQEQERIARRRAEIGVQIDQIIERADWKAVRELASQGSLAVEPIAGRLLARYRGDATLDAVTALLDIAGREPEAVCPLLAAAVDPPAHHGYPMLTVEDVLSQLASSPCSARGEVRGAIGRATEQVRAALASPAAFADLQKQFGPGFDCAALERFRVLLAPTSERACGAPRVKP